MSATRVLSLGTDVTAARQARAFVRAVVGDEVDGDVLQDALVITSELVTNAVMHAGTASELEIRLDDGVVELRVSDGDPRTPVRRRLLGGPAAQGRGLGLLAALAEQWGVDQRADGKTVWAVLARH
ncbi:MAG TPA: ATP-binding protein [Mycobacteriales bacterium]|jgi:anti-sigma regulatory factor (Ser/Thr protein kinase)|nr:ATP-binding protein [Mycobacteriales bacterium]